MTFPPNFGQAYDLSGLGKPAADTSTPMPGLVRGFAKRHTHRLRTLVGVIAMKPMEPRRMKTQAPPT